MILQTLDCPTSSRWEQRISNDSYKSKQDTGKSTLSRSHGTTRTSQSASSKRSRWGDIFPLSLQRALHLGCLRSTLKGPPPYRAVQQWCASSSAACYVTAVQDVTTKKNSPGKSKLGCCVGQEETSQRGDEARLHRVWKNIRRKETTKRFRAKE